MFARTSTVSLLGAVGHVIDVQVDVSPGVVGAKVVGRPDTAINESRERCRTAMDHANLRWPNDKRVTILLSPADVPKRGPHFDLAIAMAVLAASDPKFPGEQLQEWAMIGELTLDGQLRSVVGALPMVMAIAARGISKVLVPEPQAAEAALVAGVQVTGVRSLRQALAAVTGTELPQAPAVQPDSGERLIRWRGEERLQDIDMGDLLGMEDARFALEVAAAGGHHLMFTGPKGAGKTSLAERLPTILPDLDRDQQLELTAVYSLAGGLKPGAPLLTRPPFRAPHHSASRAAILGGGTGRIRPGEVSKAHLGVLFLDEFPLLPTDIIEALRQPLESGEISLSRGEDEAIFPARGIVVLAANPCPCGEYHPGNRDNPCICTEVRRRDYRRKLSGPIADRIDIARFVEPEFGAGRVPDPTNRPQTSQEIRHRVTAARQRQAERYSGHDWRINAHVPGPIIRQNWPMTPAAMQALDVEIYSGRITRRGATRVHRLAWTIADLRDVPTPGTDEFLIALQLRTGQPLQYGAVETIWSAS
ncbi:MAG TPA: YifB family Mg chelatase-like AAA ATPase [Marmoricola sp.]|nr:YifB family Mg chelatase-like AAA ATPase [Marmoricola sp.]